MKSLIVFLIRKHMRLKKYQCFKFGNQKDPSSCYYFTKDGLMKVEQRTGSHPSNVSINWLLNDECRITKN